MAEFDEFGAGADAAADPAADFLAREQHQLAELDENFGNDGKDGNAPFISCGMKCHEYITGI